jgi:integrase
MYAPVAVDSQTGVRRNELLAFQWTDFDEVHLRRPSYLGFPRSRLLSHQARGQTTGGGKIPPPPMTAKGFSSAHSRANMRPRMP